MFYINSDVLFYFLTYCCIRFIERIMEELNKMYRTYSVLYVILTLVQRVLYFS